MELTYQSLRTKHQAREDEHIRTEARRKNLLILILHYLTEEGYVDAANALEQETKFGLCRFEVCDNVDLETILMEYESYYYVKFQKYPKITKKVVDSTDNKSRSGGKAKRSPSGTCRNLPKISQRQGRPQSKGSPTRGQIIDFRGLIQDAIKGASSEISLHSFNCNPDPSERLLKPLGAFLGMTAEMRELATIISKDIYLQNPNVKWNCIIGLDAAKRTLSCLQAFFLLGRDFCYTGLRVLFELARYHAPSTIFLDELESVMSQRGTVLGELDYAMLRRLEKRILVDLPNQEARQAMIQHWLPPVSNSGGAAMRPVRKIFCALENHQADSGNLPVIHLDTVTTEDFLDVISHTKPSAKNLSQRYVDWQREFESV
ncbi:hypothetical protein E2320_017881 [Naja naja]|nr:hypothetical protein E2320_017881 [Naja naja]